jgi:hypothetical protein
MRRLLHQNSRLAIKIQTQKESSLISRFPTASIAAPVVVAKLRKWSKEANSLRFGLAAQVAPVSVTLSDHISKRSLT